MNRQTAEVLAGLLAFAVGAPLVYMFAAALADGQRRAEEAPLAAVLGSGEYARLAEGDSTGLHYLAPEDTRERRRAPDFQLRDERGQAWRLSDQRGKVVVINFWSKTCRPCLEEMPSLVSLGRQLEGREDVEFVTISTDQNWNEVAGVFRRTPPTFPILFDPDKAVTRDLFGTRLYPETWFIDPDGVIRLRVDGPRDWSQAVVLELIDQFRS